MDLLLAARRGSVVLALCAGLCGCRSAREGKSDLPAGGTFEDGLSVEVRFEGNTAFSDKRLRRVVEVDLDQVERRSSVRAAVDDAAYSLELFHRANGFPGCAVDYSVETVGVGQRLATLSIDEGVRVEIVAVEFSGNDSLGGRELQGYLRPPAGGLFTSSRVWYVETAVQEGLAAVGLHYRARGFLDAEVELNDPTPAGGVWPSELVLEVQVREGPRYVLRAVDIAGGVPEVEAGFELAPWLGAPLTRRSPRVLRAALVERYARAGYPDARVEEVARDLAPSGDARLGLSVTPGPRVTVASVRIEGLERTSRARVLDAIELQAGERYDLALERKSFRNLYGLRVFSSVRLELVGEGSERELAVTVQEAPSREVYVEPGYGSYERLRIGLGWSERNLFGGARSLEVEGRISELAQRGVVSLTDPRLFGSDTRGSFTLFANQRQEPSFLSADYGSALTLSRRIARQFTLSAAYQFRLSTVEADDLSDPDVQSALEDINISSVTVRPSWDTRDSPFLPSSGALARASLEVADAALGSELDFLRSNWTTSWFQSVWRRGTLGASWRGGVIVPTGATDTIPVQERFFNGGENTVRSFREDQLGPEDVNGSPLGGEAFNVLTLELRQRLQGRLEGAAFYDGGNVVPDAGDYFDMRGFRHALGLGLRYVLPVGPMRLDLAWNPDARGGESDFTLHFAVGFSF